MLPKKGKGGEPPPPPSIRCYMPVKDPSCLFYHPHSFKCSKNKSCFELKYFQGNNYFNKQGKAK